MAGVDGVRDAWIVALVTGSGAVSWARCVDARAVLDVTAGCAAVAVDIPLAVPVDDHRRCERVARERLGTARSSIFFTPVRAVLGCTDYQQACAVSRAVSRDGKGISLQTWGLVPKIRDWDAARPGPHVVEAHPELSFRAMAPDRGFAGKKTARGAAHRLAALGGWLGDRNLLDTLAAAPDRIPLDDALDALACAWTARRFSLREHERLTDEVDPDTGRVLSIVV